MKIPSFPACILLFIGLALLSFTTYAQPQDSGTALKERIQPYSENSFYWQYDGEPLFLIGGSWQDNLFNHPTGLEGHLDLLTSVGGNYVRNVMSHRNMGNVFTYIQKDDGLYDLDHFNEEYWQRFENFLEMTYERDIIVQLEVWATWDLYEDHQSLGGWSYNPLNPVNNSSYNKENSGLPVKVNYAPQSNPTSHPFFRSIPELDNNKLLLAYQQEYVDKILSYSLQYPHILYTINNETGEHLEWGDYWADYVRNQAEEMGVQVHVTDMRRNENIRGDDHGYIFNNPDRYTFVDISQNNAFSGLGESHYESILYVRNLFKDLPRPINNNKNYGGARHGEEESVARMGRILFGGAASARFHRPHPIEDPGAHEAKSDYGLGLSPRAQKIIQSISRVTGILAFERTQPRGDLLHSVDEVYLLAEPGIQYAAYYPFGGTATIDIEPTGENFQYRWINLDQGRWSKFGTESTEGLTKFTAPDSGHWILVVLKEFSNN
ncbi:MAG: putative collagen-binding domain-containing protein [Balneolales bacterium]